MRPQVPVEVLSVFCAASALLAGCASTPPLEVRTLPFHVAIVPMADAVVGETLPGELPGEATELRLALTTSEVTEAVSSALDEYCFSRVTVIDPLDLGESADAFERERRVLEFARAAEADLLVELDLRYDPQIYRESSSIFWLNFPLFLFAGPSHWFIGDNGYFADVELTTTVYDMNVMEAGAFSMGDPAARVVSASSRFTGSDLTFTQRSEGLGDYVLGIFVPSGYLARESETTGVNVHQEVLEGLRAQVVQGIQSRRGDLVRADWIAPAFIDPDDVLLTRDGSDLIVRGAVRLRRGGLVDRVQAVVLEAGGERIVVRPVVESTSSAGDFDVIPFVGRVPGGARTTALRIECEAGSRDRFVRSYTFEVPLELRREPAGQ